MSRLMRQLIPNVLINYGKHLPTALVANLRYGFPSKGLVVIGVTGTDGKTTTVNMIYQVLKNAGRKVSMISTINAVIGAKPYDTGSHITSPSPYQLQKYIKEAKQAGEEYLVLEVTSHGLAQFRTLGIKFDIGVVTNITHEHLDYHGSWENYFKAKAKLIKKVRIAILNHDERHFSRLSKLTGGQVVSFGLTKLADFNPRMFPLKLKIPGEFNLLNALAAWAVCVNLGIDSNLIRQALEEFTTLPGRMEEVANNKGIKIIVDFAHTPNGLKQALKTLRGKTKGKLVSIIGAEGKRDELKRPMMGEIAAKLSDFVVVTAVDPRGCLDKINQQIFQGAKTQGVILGKDFFIINDRLTAIKHAINKLAKKGDTIGIFGKGHERSMNLDGKNEIAWSDREAVRQALDQK